MQKIKYPLNEHQRHDSIDILRGFAVVLMIVFHFSFDLIFFNLVKFDIVNHPFWYFFPRLIVFLFLFAVGSSLFLSHQKGINGKKFLRRLLLISFWAAVISLVTYLFFPDHWIYFGTLHAIAVVSVISLPFIHLPRTALITGSMLFFFSIFFDQTLPWFELPHSSWDYISPFPWLGASLFGIFAAHKGWHELKFPSNIFFKSLNYLGKNSLFIYLIHQPILFVLFIIAIKLFQILAELKISMI